MRAAKGFFAVSVIGILCLTTGCQNLSRHIRAYDGPPLATNQIALLKVQWELAHVMLSVNKVDDKRPKRYFASEIELLPGLHLLEVSYRDSSGFKSTQDATIGFDAAAGSIYELHGEAFEMTLKQMITKEFVPFSHWKWTLWIVDAGTGKVVAGIPRTTPLHWYEK
jgi:hypothetical protein